MLLNVSRQPTAKWEAERDRFVKAHPFVENFCTGDDRTCAAKALAWYFCGGLACMLAGVAPSTSLRTSESAVEELSEHEAANACAGEERSETLALIHRPAVAGATCSSIMFVSTVVALALLFAPADASHSIATRAIDAFRRKRARGGSAARRREGSARGARGRGPGRKAKPTRKIIR